MKEPAGSLGLAELEERLSVTTCSKSQRLKEHGRLQQANADKLAFKG